MIVVDVQFPLCGKRIPVDHGYSLCSAVSRILPELHGNESVGIHPISGRPAGDRCQMLSENSFLTIRLPSDRIAQVLPLAGKNLLLGEHEVRVGVPQTCALVPAARLYSRLVVIKGFMDPEPFMEAVQRQLDSMNIQGSPSLVEQDHIARANEGKRTGTRSPYLRRTIRIRNKEIVGFAVRIQDLTAEESIRLQEKGLGGRRRFGCGVFIPVK